MGNNNLKGSLELNWINKDKSLLYEIDEKEGIGVKSVWVDKNDIRVSEPRNLKLVREFRDLNNENMLIKGDNLLALRSLVEEFKNRDEKDKVKCIYIDPPFNTGAAFKHYDDNLEHSQWLTMMRDRLILLKKLLREDGFIFVHIDEREVAYLKILMDEIFGSANFQTMITWQRAPQRTVLGQGQTAVITIAEYILCYSRNFTRGKLNAIKKQYKATDKIMSQYRLTLTLGKEKLVEKFQNGENNSSVKIYAYDNYKINTLPIRGISKSEYINKFSELYQSAGIHKEHSFMQRVLERLKKDTLYRVEYTPTRGKSAGKEVSDYILNRRKLLPARDYASIGSDGEIYRTVDMNNIWLDDEINVTGIAQEGGVDLRRGKKPEALLKRMIELSTMPGDLVLDSFLGSGTTVAVAHKLGRKWIGIELGKHCETLALPRLKRVVSGEDQTAISKEVCWKGGGGFRYYVVGESLIHNSDMNWDLTYEEIAQALFRMFDYSFVGKLEDEIYVGKRTGKYALSIVTKDLDIIKSEDLDKIIETTGEKHKNMAELEIYTNKGVGIKEEDLPEGVSIKKVPESILRKYKL